MPFSSGEFQVICPVRGSIWKMPGAPGTPGGMPPYATCRDVLPGVTLGLLGSW